MDGTAAIKFNLVALKRILAGLVSMAGFGPSAIGGRQPGLRAADGTTPPDCLLPAADCRLLLPRHLRLAILRLLRPAESAARRLIIASARGLVVSLPPPRKASPKPATAEPFLRRFGIAVVVSPADLAHGAAILPRSRRVSSRFAEGKSIVPVVRWKAGERWDAAQQRGPGRQETNPRVLPPARPRTGSAGGGGGLGALPLFDPPRRLPSLSKRRAVPAHAAPRISFPGFAASPHPGLRAKGKPRSADDPVDCTRLNLRLAALAAALDDLPAQARRFARWKARRDALPCAAESRSDAAGARKTPGRIRRVSPLRPGRPPGGRLARYDPAARQANRIREVDEVLAHAHALALYALEKPDTS